MIYIFFILGCIIGSFGNVLISRGLKEESVIYPSSYCDNCGENLSWYNLIPIISYIFQGGGCSRCSGKIPIKYSIFEFINGIIYIINYKNIGSLLPALIISLEMTLLMVMSIIDIKTLNVYRFQIILLFVLGNIFMLFTDGINLYKTFIIFLIYIVFKTIEKKNIIDKIGFGDIYILLALLVQFNLYDFLVFLILIGLISGIIAGVLLILEKNLKLKVPFIPILTLGFTNFYLLGDKFKQILEGIL